MTKIGHNPLDYLQRYNIYASLHTQSKSLLLYSTHSSIVSPSLYKRTAGDHADTYFLHTENTVSITLLSPRQQGGITFTPVVLNSSYEIFGLSATLENVGDTARDLWSCSIFLISNNEIVAITRPVRLVVFQTRVM